ncbi:LysR family transcriptional regulator [Alicycliphilus denitrificans]|uniref:Transcriptional regulator, LysR family n=2 Tax=Alicycliphilus denitrificans TaxID=179636 RepID=F4GEG6_ALIDK|nr:LysR family transcriptional regulator [Alicycliphilus denitrificans]ADU98085.1 LysR substrate-binding protein [Alicycliphilus denitrificans BC]AEB82681.1 transcriptional regulator, LysR family [Alicycliphilus denitrificans K601]QKD42372.1 LysR family transcriptional regulator [Alicycliphilus denitrificans]GAO25983.1 LysR family transcriptional regulator [Alicycliphilus sp. B1]
MDLVALDIFRTVAAEGSVTRAAERLGRAQSNATTRVQQLEEDLGVPLFLREGRRMRLTPEGETLLAYADRLLALAEEARQALHPGAPTGRLRIGAMESTAAARLPGPLARLHAQWPALSLELRTAPSRQLADQVLAHQLDCALVAWPPPGLEADAPIERTPVFAESLLLALPASHPPAATPADLRVHLLAAFAQGCTYRRIGEDWMRQGGAPVEVLELASYPAILACVAAGRCAGVVPQSVLQLLRTPPPLRWVPLGTCDTMLLHRPGYATPALAALQSALLSHQDAP